MAEQHDLENRPLTIKPNEKNELELVKSRNNRKSSKERTDQSYHTQKTSDRVQENYSGLPKNLATEDSSESKTEKVLIASHAKTEHKNRKRKIAPKTGSNDRDAIENKNTENSGFRVYSEIPTKLPDNEGVGRRISFIVRITMDEENECRRVEIEDTLTRKRGNFNALNGEQLADFMRDCLSTTMMTALVTPQEKKPKKEEVPAAESRRQSSLLTISNVQAMCRGSTDMMTLAFSSEEPFLIQATFKIHIAEFHELSTQESSYEMNVYAYKLGSNESNLLNTYHGNLVKDIIEYTVQTEESYLTTGVYRLVTLIILHGPTREASIYEGPIIQIS